METRATLQELDDSFPQESDEEFISDDDDEEKSSSPQKRLSSPLALGRTSRSRSTLGLRSTYTMNSALSRTRSHALSLSNARLNRTTGSSSNMSSNNPNSALSPPPRMSRHTRSHTHSHTRSPQLRGRTRTLTQPHSHSHSSRRSHAAHRHPHTRSISSVSPLRRTRHNVHTDTPTPTLGKGLSRAAGVGVGSKSASGSPMHPPRLYQRHNSTPLFTRVGSRSPPGRPSVSRMLSLPSFPSDRESPPELRQAAQAHAWVRKAIEVQFVRLSRCTLALEVQYLFGVNRALGIVATISNCRITQYHVSGGQRCCLEVSSLILRITLLQPTHRHEV